MIIKSLGWGMMLVLFIAVCSCEKSNTNENDRVEDANKVTDGYVLYSYLEDYTTHLIDTAGEDVKTWTSSYSSAGAVYLTSKKTLLRAGKTSASKYGTFGAGGANSGIIEELDDESNVIWSYQRDDDSCTLHHDFKEIDDNTIIACAWKLVEYNGIKYWDDHVLIIDKKTNTITWDWSAFYDGGILPDENSISRLAPVDSIGEEPEPGISLEDYMHINSVAYKNGSILISSREHNTLYIINKESKEITATYTAGGTLSHQHDATFLDNGNILVFNNDASENESEVLEINASDEVVWKYSNNFYSGYISGIQRLESGNSLICLGVLSQFFEVTSDGEVVWEFFPEAPDFVKLKVIFKIRKYSKY